MANDQITNKLNPEYLLICMYVCNVMKCNVMYVCMCVHIAKHPKQTLVVDIDI